MIRGPLAAAVAAACLLGGALPAHAETFPAKPVRLLSPFPAGSGPDAVSRLIGDRLGRDWNQPVIVDARPGGNGFIAMEATRRSPATGYELGIADVGHLASQRGRRVRWQRQGRRMLRTTCSHRR
ncbi:Bug family tripartite tricarboxylate transporter substrate binding protein [Cupriavidus sp. YAF13]|uniref:Bug family tripartite tricarboxylate transporter substrate binding protein n=1 Tax=Cupriavidus sp. YAF13 TaxID=3233075 RepID=UPI003F93A1EC